MRSGVTRATLRREVQIEAGISTAAGHTVQMDERINHLLNRVQRSMETEHTWPTMNWEQEVTVPANSATGTLPSNITFTNIREVRVASGGLWLPVYAGIGPNERSLYKGTDRASPTQRYEIVYPGTTTFEVWPISPIAETLLFVGTRAVTEMNTDSDTCVLDADALVLLTAAEVLAKGSPEEAALKQSLGRARIRRLLGLQSGVKDRRANLATRPGRTLRPYIDFIPPQG
jgi:hypothetical protein